MERPIISTHIAKAAGTSLEKFWYDAFGCDNVLVWNPSREKLLRASDASMVNIRTSYLGNFLREFGGKCGITPIAHRLVIRVMGKNEKGFEPEDLKHQSFSVIHGHFPANHFDKHLTVPTFSTIVLRDPLSRAVSHYEYMRRTDNKLNHWPQIPNEHIGSFADFIRIPQVINYQFQYLGGKSLSDFDLVGITENMKQFICQLVNTFKLNPNLCLPNLNRNPNSSKDSLAKIGERIKADFRRLNDVDYALYNNALSLQPTI
jgi:hypothetical protein